MKTAAAALSPVPELGLRDSTTREVHLLTGAQHWPMTAFAAHSFAHHIGQAIRLVFHDDGTLPRDNREILRRVFPEADLPTPDEAEARLDAVLPTNRYPTLRTHRLAFPFLRKLLDVHAGRDGWRLYLDSDTLTYETPTSIGRWIATPDRPIYMQDDWNAYGPPPAPEAILRRLAGVPIPFGVNAGVCGFRSDSVDWDRVERWTRELLVIHGPNHFIEQALTAMIVAPHAPAAIPSAECGLVRSAAGFRSCHAPVRHYVMYSRPAYLAWGWRQYLAAVARPAVERAGVPS